MDSDLPFRWDATYALRERLSRAGIKLQGRPGGWAEAYRVFKECKVHMFPGFILQN